MFYIDQSTTQFQHAREEHLSNIRYIIKKKLLGEHFIEAHPKGLDRKIRLVTGIHSNVSKFLNDDKNLRDLIDGYPDVLDRLKSKFKSKREIASIKKLFRYDAFINKNLDNTFGFYNAYNLAENLDIQTCVYCNRLYTNTIITIARDFIVRPTFDHWFLKSEYPLLALSFFNLIPSCNVCNSSVKGANSSALRDIFHPYFKHTNINKVLDFKFSYTLEDHLNAHCKIVSANNFTLDSIESLKLNDIYQAHREEIRELIYLKKAYSETYLASLKAILRTSVTNSEIYRLAFGVYYEDQWLIKRPLSKLKKDVLAELGILS
ncbi:hypothetical protein [Pedobacter namyangjuensis]|uniref:hypothetical protein n=1 Tax=Pedobacter namyangjuensis TaxID=600626 RepID=UPI000DE1A7C1|nr:hypothetical protein [Pedobacter namyangjuensis]